MARSNEAFFWSLFSAGGVVAALFIPAIMLATGFLLPTEDPEAAVARYDQVYSLVHNPLTKVVLFGVLFLSFFHCAHRIQHTLKDLGLRPVGPAVAWTSYLAALAGTIVAGYLIFPL